MFYLNCLAKPYSENLEGALPCGEGVIFMYSYEMVQRQHGKGIPGK